MTITNVQLRDFCRAHPHLIAVRRTDWAALTAAQRAIIRAGLDKRGVTINEPAVWTLTGPMDPDNPVPNADQLYVADHDHLSSQHRAVLSINYAVAAPVNLPAATLDAQGKPIIDAAYRAAFVAAYKTQVDTEMAARGEGAV